MHGHRHLFILIFCCWDNVKNLLPHRPSCTNNTMTSGNVLKQTAREQIDNNKKENQMLSSYTYMYFRVRWQLPWTKRVLDLLRLLPLPPVTLRLWSAKHWPTSPRRAWQAIVAKCRKIQDWILKLWKRILRFFSKPINARSLVSWCVKGTEDSTLGKDSSVPLMHHDLSGLGLICLVEKCKICFPI